MNDNIPILINLPFILLKHIVDHIDDNLDRFSLTLVCKKLFRDRDKYLYLKINDNFHTKSRNVSSENNQRIENINVDLIDQRQQEEQQQPQSEIKYFKLYSNIIEKSVYYYISNHYKSIKFETFLSTSDVKKEKFFETIVDIQSISQDNKKFDIPNDVTSIDYSGVDQSTIPKSYDKLLSQMNGITMLTLGYNLNITCLPPKLETLTISSLPQSLLSSNNNNNNNSISTTSNFLPKSLKIIRIMSVKSQLQPGIFPDSLIYLVIGTYTETFIAGSLPRSLLLLSINKYNHKIKSGVLPNVLRTLNLAFYSHKIDQGVLPDSITTIQGVKPNLISHLFLPNLEVLDIERCDFNNGDDGYLNLSETLPKNVSTFKYNIRTIKLKDIPNSIRHICMSQYGTNSMAYRYTGENQYKSISDFPESVTSFTIDKFNIRRLDRENYLIYENEYYNGGFLTLGFINNSIKMYL